MRSNYIDFSLETAAGEQAEVCMVDAAVLLNRTHLYEAVGRP